MLATGDSSRDNTTQRPTHDAKLVPSIVAAMEQEALDMNFPIVELFTHCSFLQAQLHKLFDDPNTTDDGPLLLSPTHGYRRLPATAELITTMRSLGRVFLPSVQPLFSSPSVAYAPRLLFLSLLPPSA